MKKISVTGLFLILLYFSGYSQEVNSSQNPEPNSQFQPTGNKYAEQNLQQVSNDELKLYLKKANGLKTTGTVMTFSGPVLMLAGIIMEIGWLNGGGPVVLAGLASTAVGIPLWVTGSKRSKKVNHEFQKRAGVSFNVAPGLIYNSKIQNPSPAFTFRVAF